MIHPKQPQRIVEKQLHTAEKALVTKRQALAGTSNKSHQTRIRLEITELERRIAEYQTHLAGSAL